MLIDFRKLFNVTIIPVSLLACSIYFVPQLTKPLPNALQVILPFLPFVIFIVGMGLSWIFHHSREFNLFLILMVVYISLDNYIWHPSNKIDFQLAYLLLVSLIPINYTYNLLLRERGILNHYGVRRFIFLAVQLYFVAWILENPLPQVKEYLSYTFFQHSLFKQTDVTQPILLAIFITALIIIVRLLQNTSNLVASILISYIAVLAALYFAYTQQLALIFILLAGLILIIGITINAYSLAYLDELTNLPSRRALNQNITTLGKKYTLAMVDVDHFKKFNDKYGHDIGDQVLKKLASQLRLVRGGKAFRYGGEEFTLIFPNKDFHEARLICNELCKTVANSPFMLRNKKRPKKITDGKKPSQSGSKPLTITISIGLAERSEEFVSSDQVMKQADKALYKAKKNGRNQVAV